MASTFFILDVEWEKGSVYTEHIERGMNCNAENKKRDHKEKKTLVVNDARKLELSLVSVNFKFQECVSKFIRINSNKKINNCVVRGACALTVTLACVNTA